jgi:hypothetical protein
MHLTLEALARLVDEPPAPAEAAHLRDCLVCRRELAGLREQTASLAALGGVPSPAAWEELCARLEEEGLVRAAPRRTRFGAYRPQARAAAAAVLFLAGGASGALLWSGRTAPPTSADAEGPRFETATSRPVPHPELVYYEEAPAAAPSSGARLVSTADAAPAPGARRREANPGPARVRGTAREAERAAAELLEAQTAFVVALQRLAAAADPASGNDPGTRLAALERLVGLTAAALERAPGDPVINGYHLAAAAERAALRRQIEKDARTEWF